jgi:hypothetical protein
MYARRWLYIILMSIGFFTIGISFVIIIRWPVIGPAVCVTGLSLTALAVRVGRTFDDGRDSVSYLLRDICHKTTSLVGEGYRFLVPPRGDAGIRWVRIGTDHEGVVILEEEGHNGTLRRYSINTSTGEILRSALGDELTNRDYEWCHDDLTTERLEHLLAALSGRYSPLRSVTSQ